MSLRLIVLLCLIVVATSDFRAWINEFHYRNYKDDQNLFVEVVGPAGVEAWQYLLVLYQGRNGSQFKDAFSLSGNWFNEGVVGDFGFIKYDFEPKGSIRNGKQGGDGVALIHNGECVQFLCYNDHDAGTFTAWTGPCEGIACTNVGVHEARDNPVGKSIQMVGSGRYMQNFTWHDQVMDWTPGQINNGQFLLTPEEYSSANSQS